MYLYKELKTPQKPRQLTRIKFLVKLRQADRTRYQIGLKYCSVCEIWLKISSYTFHVVRILSEQGQGELVILIKKIHNQYV